MSIEETGEDVQNNAITVLASRALIFLIKKFENTRRTRNKLILWPTFKSLKIETLTERQKIIEKVKIRTASFSIDVVEPREEPPLCSNNSVSTSKFLDWEDYELLPIMDYGAEIQT